eukprot:234644-Chlamydomonas_euryale.AAC.10
MVGLEGAGLKAGAPGRSGAEVEEAEVQLAMRGAHIGPAVACKRRGAGQQRGCRGGDGDGVGLGWGGATVLPLPRLTRCPETRRGVCTATLRISQPHGHNKADTGRLQGVGGSRQLATSELAAKMLT